MQHNEYLIISLTAKPISGSQVTIYWPDGRATTEDDVVVVLLNRLATEGWEVVTSAGGHGVFHWTLKRSILQSK